MKGGAGDRWVALDQIRAVAAFLVFVRHFTHPNEASVSFSGVPAFPFAAVLHEGQTGVALFMCLSGYLFAKLLDGKAVRYPAFLEARAYRLFPLLLFVFAVTVILESIRGEPLGPSIKAIISGFVKPYWPNGGWSITAEIHFYLILPFLLIWRKRAPWLMPATIAAAILVRLGVYEARGSVQTLAYFTIFGRIDQFILGIAAFDLRGRIRYKPALAFAASLLLALGCYHFASAGGMWELEGDPSRSPIWVFIPTFEAIVYSVLIVWYDTSDFATGKSLIGRMTIVFGKYSYGIYLLHPFFVRDLNSFLNGKVMSLSNFYVATMWAIPAFFFMLLPAYIVNRLIEQPLQRRKRGYAEPALSKAGSGKAALSNREPAASEAALPAPTFE